MLALLPSILIMMMTLPSAGAKPTQPMPPTVVVIVVDDQRWDTLSTMPHVQALLMNRGVTFSNAYTVSPSCCPSRASTLTGLYPMHTGVWRNRAPYGGFSAFADTSTLPVWLQGAGFQTGLFGKYLNQYQHAGADQRYVPPGWTRWFAVWGDYYGYKILDQTELLEGGVQEEDYATDVETRQAASFIRETPGPLFAYVSFRGVHDPFTPAPRHADEFGMLEDWRPLSYNERDVSDKPGWVQGQARLGLDERERVDGARVDQYRALLSVDEGVGEIVEALRLTGRLSTSLIVYMSDNGFTWGEHRLFGKGDPYEESIRIPMVVRYDPAVATPGLVDPHLVLNVDVAPTVAAATGVDIPPVDGRSLLPLLDGAAQRWRGHFLTMRMSNGQPSFCQIHTRTRAFTLYATGEEEDYRLSTDPSQLTNIAGTRAGRTRRAELRTQLLSLCTPLPPDMSP